MDASLIAVPYHLGREDVVLGRGPARLLDELAADGFHVRTVERPVPFYNEVSASMAVVRALAEDVRAVVRTGGLPLVLAGNCNSSLGTVAGIGAHDLAVIWFDAHGDFHTPDTSTSGFFDGMGLAMLTGSGWRALRESVDGLEPVAEERVVLVGARDLEPEEEQRFADSGVTLTDAAGLPAALDRLAPIRRAYLHIDLDVLDPSEGRANHWAAPGGLMRTELERAVDEILVRFELAAGALTAYDPTADEEGAVARVARSLALRLAARTEARV